MFVRSDVCLGCCLQVHLRNAKENGRTYVVDTHHDPIQVSGTFSPATTHTRAKYPVCRLAPRSCS